MSDCDSDPSHGANSESVDIGGVAIKRASLVELLPDVARFERHRSDALALDAEMSDNDGAIPAYINYWPPERIEAVVATLKEIGSLRAEVQRQQKADADSATGDNTRQTDERPVSDLFRRGKG